MSKEAAERLIRNEKRIMKIWESRIRSEVPAAREKKSLALQNELSSFIRLLAEKLSSNVVNETTEARIAFTQESKRIGVQHGRERARSIDYTLAQMIFEYHILRQTIGDVLEEEAPLSAAERELIVAATEQMVNDAASEFSDALRDIQERIAHAMAHDLRGPITTAKARSQLILRRPNDADHCSKLAARICSDMDRLDSMIHDLLDASRIRAGEGLPLQFEECDLDLIAREVADEIRPRFRNVAIVASGGPCVGYWSDSGMRRLIENLVTNAAKHGDPNAPVTITIVQTQDRVKLSVHNEGNPIPQEEQNHLFERYRRTRSAESKVGWGIGLTIVKGMADAHHGTVRLESGEGKGTTFTVELPRDWRKLRAAS